MKIIDLLNKIANGEMEEAIFYVNGDFFYYLIVIDKELYVINTIAKKLVPLENKYISRFIKDNVELIRLDKEVEIIEEEKEMPENLYAIFKTGDLTIEYPHNRELMDKINEVIDYLKSKGE